MQTICEYRMKSDGIQAPGAIVIRQRESEFHPFIVHFRNDQDGGFYEGDYCENLDQAELAFNAKCRRYDPTGELHAD